MDLILLGAPGAGKGTQGALLTESLGVPKIATGDMLREAIRAGSALGLKAKAVMDAGQLVSDEIVLGLVREALSAPAAQGGAVFDGYPRNVAQAGALDRLLSELGRKIDAVVHLVVPEEAIVERMDGRRTDPVTQTVYHLVHNPPPPEVAGRVVQRPDDRAETVRDRFRVYREQTAPLVAFYRERGVPVHDVDGDRGIDVVQKDVLSRLGR
jgi:adenylate kinase